METGGQLFRRPLRTLLVSIGTVVIAVTLPFLPLGLLFLLIIRRSVELIAQIFRPDLDQVFQDAGVVCALEPVYSKPKLNMVFHFILDRPIELEKLQVQFQQRVINFRDDKGTYKYARLQQTWEQFLGFFFWKWDKDFHIKHHIRLYDYQSDDVKLPKVCTEDDLKSITGSLVARHYSEGHSPWEILLIPKFRNSTGKETSVLVLRIHHTLADGFSVLKLLFRLADKDDIRLPQAKFPELSKGQKIRRNVFIALRAPYDIASVAFDAYDGPNCWHIVKEKLCGQYETFFSDQIPVWKIKGIMKEYNVNYNAAVYAITAGAMVRLMKEANQKVPKCFSVVVPYPLPEHPGGLVNHLSAHVFNFTPEGTGGPEGRLRQVSNYVKSADELDTIAAIFSWFACIATLVPVWALRLVYDRAMMTVGMTSVPGPMSDLELMDGLRVTDMIPAIGHFPGKLGAVAMLLSMGGKQRIVVTVDRKVLEGVKRPSRFAAHIHDELEALWSAC